MKKWGTQPAYVYEFWKPSSGFIGGLISGALTTVLIYGVSLWL